jgi:hypothetical protein
VLRTPVVEEPRSGVSKPPPLLPAQVVEERTAGGGTRLETAAARTAHPGGCGAAERRLDTAAALFAQVVEERTAGGGTRLETAAATRG